MARIKGPLLSLSARGQIGKAMVFGDWRGVKYVREHVVPANPRTTEQTLTRNTFTYGDDQFKRMLTLAQSPWAAAAIGKAFTARNSFIKNFVQQLRGEADMTNYIASPGVNGGLPLLSFAAVDAVAPDTVDITAEIPPEPVGWTHDAVVYTAFTDRAGNAQMADFVVEDEDLAAGWAAGPPPVSTLSLAGLNDGDTFCVSGFLRSTRADGVTAYGISSTLLVALA